MYKVASQLNSLKAEMATKAIVANPIFVGATRVQGPVVFSGTVSGVAKKDVGLLNVDNSSDTSKPISSAVQSALDGKADVDDLFQGVIVTTIESKATVDGPTFTGIVNGIANAMVGLGKWATPATPVSPYEA